MVDSDQEFVVGFFDVVGELGVFFELDVIEIFGVWDCL